MYFYIKRLKSYGITTNIITLLTLLAFLSTVTEILGIGMFIPIFEFIQGDMDSFSLDKSENNGIVGYIESLLAFIGLEKTFESLILFTFFLFLFSKIVTYIITYTGSYYTGIITMNMRAKLLKLYLGASSEYYDKVKIGDFTNISFIELNKARAVIQGNVVNLVCSLFILCCCRKQVHLNGVFYVAEVSTCFPISIDKNLFTFDDTANPFGYDGRISTIWILPFSEDIEVTQTNCVETICSSKDRCIEFID